MMKMSNKMYDTLKWVAQYALPGIATAYFTLAQIWGLPCAEQVVGTITAFDTLLGVMLGVSTSQYKRTENFGDGTMVIDTSNPEKDVYRMVLNSSIDSIKDKNTITFKVARDPKLGG